SDDTRDIDGVSHYVINIEISSASHPFFTGEERFVDTAGRVDKFKEKLDRVEAAAKERKGKKAKREAKVALKKQEEKKKAPAKKEKPVVEAPVETPEVVETPAEAPVAEVPANDATEK
ncbi:MAG: 50S ribosomal protein L31, partial [Candidatus Magasanikbacteria bacterium CG_4_10_14_0_8_um_filter_42_12]